MDGNRKSVSIHCTKTGIHVYGANNIGSTSDTIVNCKRRFLQVCSVWWNTYFGRDDEDEQKRNCDVGTADEQAIRFDQFCEERDCVKCHAHNLWHHYFDLCKNQHVTCGLIWAQMPYEAQEGGAE